MSRFRAAHHARLRLQSLPGFTALPRCEFCGGQFHLRDWRRHVTRCERDCASECILALDKRLAQLHSTEPQDLAHDAAMDEEAEALRQERWEAHNTIFGFDAMGRGRLDTGVLEVPGEFPF